jgi:hypothetical protein
VITIFISGIDGGNAFALAGHDCVIRNLNGYTRAILHTSQANATGSHVGTVVAPVSTNQSVSSEGLPKVRKR